MSDTLRDTSGLIIGTVEGATAEGAPLVAWSDGDNDGESRSAAAIAAWMNPMPQWASCVGARVVLGFVGSERAQPVLLALLDAPAAVEPAPAKIPKTARIESQEDLILQCGKARIALRADGRITLHGAYVLTSASGPVKIKGASVDIN